MTATAEKILPEATTLTPKQIVEELDRFIIGQLDAKRAVAIALRNRWRRKQVPEELRDEIVPKNILMIGPTGVGKTEISRRLAKLVQAPFIKVEATKFTEVGYVGRDVESIVRDIIESAVLMAREQYRKSVYEKAKIHAAERVVDALTGDGASTETRDKFREMLFNDELNDREVEIDVLDNSPPPGMPTFDIPGMPGSQMGVGVINLSDMLGKAFGGERRVKKRMKVSEAHDVLVTEECDNLVDEEKIVKEAVEMVEQDGIVFIDEIDKIAVRQEIKGGEVSREGVQRDLLPLIEGTTVSTKYGPVKTDHILFIASGAFHMAKPSDLLPELQGRLPIRVELGALTLGDMERILKEPEASLLKQYSAMLATEGLDVTFTDDGVKAIAELTTELNREVENIGARRLHTLMEKLLETINFEATDMKEKTITIDAAYVHKQLGDLVKHIDLSKFIL